MNILFITSNRLGDAVLSTGLIAHITRTYPDASLTIACGGLPSSLFEAVPGMAEIIVIKKRKYNKHWFDLWRLVRKTRWDMVVDLRDSAVSRLIPAKQRHIHGKRIDKSLHKVEQVAAVMGLETVPSPTLWFTKAQQEKAVALIPEGGPVLGIGPTANWAGKIWPAENFIALIEKLTAPDGIFSEARVAVFAAPGEEEQARPVFESIPANRRLDAIAKASPGEAAAALSRCDLYIGHDSGLMHCAAAAGTPTVGLFGPSHPKWYRPWGEHCIYVQTPESFDELIDFDGYDSKTVGSLMTSLRIGDVEKAIGDFWAKRQKAA